jgi:predicted small secreted protein
MLKTAMLALLAVAVLVLVGCNTIEGLGKDVQKAGEGIENVSKKK